MQLFKFFKKKRPTIIIDMLSLFRSLGIKSSVSPRIQLQILRRITKFSDRENIKVIAILSGEPLRKAPDKKYFENILILYSVSSSTHLTKAIKVAKSKNGVLVSDDQNIKAINPNITIMRCRTFTRVFELNVEARARDNNFKSRINNNDNKINDKLSYSKGNSQNDAINELIDLVE